MLEKYNFHWKEGFLYNFQKKRYLYEKLTSLLGEPQIISLIGLRRTGKTTLLKQIIDRLIESKKTNRDHIVYYSFDEDQPRLDELFSEYEAKLGISILESKEKFYIFLDEIQKLNNWENQIKYYYDNYKNIKFFVSGSSSLFIKKASRESLAGRIYEFILQPLSFSEFLMFKNKEEFIEKKKLFAEAIKKEFQSFIKRQFIEIIDKNEDLIKEYTKSILEKIVYQDIPKVFPIEHEDLLIRLLKIIAAHPGILSNYEGLSKELGISRITLSNYFYYLEESFLIRKLYNFSKNALSSEKKLKRFYLITTSFYEYLNDAVDVGRLIENLVISQTKAKFFWRDPFKNEVDLILEQDKKIVPIEVKYQNTITKNDLKGLLKFCDKFRLSKAILLTKDLQKSEKIRLNGKTLGIEYIPIHLFLLDNP